MGHIYSLYPTTTVEKTKHIQKLTFPMIVSSFVFSDWVDII